VKSKTPTQEEAAVYLPNMRKTAIAFMAFAGVVTLIYLAQFIEKA
jgi:hypothetical protein